MQFETSCLIALISNSTISFVAGLALPVKCPWAAVRLPVCLLLPFVVAYLVFGPERAELGSNDPETRDLPLMYYLFLGIMGLGPSFLGAFGGFVVRAVTKK